MRCRAYCVVESSLVRCRADRIVEPIALSSLLRCRACYVVEHIALSSLSVVESSLLRCRACCVVELIAFSSHCVVELIAVLSSAPGVIAASDTPTAPRAQPGDEFLPHSYCTCLAFSSYSCCIRIAWRLPSYCAHAACLLRPCCIRNKPRAPDVGAAQRGAARLCGRGTARRIIRR